MAGRISAEYYDLQIDDPRHRMIRDDGFVDDLYYLSWFREFNEFRVSEEEFEKHWQETVRRELPQSLWLLKAAGRRDFMTIWLKSKYRQSEEHKRFPIPNESKDDRAVVLLLNDPTLTDEQIRVLIDTTPKTMQRWTMYKYARREMRFVVEGIRNDS